MTILSTFALLTSPPPLQSQPLHQSPIPESASLLPPAQITPSSSLTSTAASHKQAWTHPSIYHKRAVLTHCYPHSRRCQVNLKNFLSDNRGIDAQEQLKLIAMQAELEEAKEKLAQMEVELQVLKDGGGKYICQLKHVSTDCEVAIWDTKSLLAYIQLEKHNESVGQYKTIPIKLSNAETQIDGLKAQLNDVLRAEEMLVQLTEWNHMLGEKIEMCITTKDPEALKELNDEWKQITSRWRRSCKRKLWMGLKIDLINTVVRLAHGLPKSLNGDANVSETVMGICEMRGCAAGLAILCKCDIVILMKTSVAAFLQDEGMVLEISGYNPEPSLFNPLQKLFCQCKSAKVLFKSDLADLKAHLLGQLKSLSNAIPELVNFGICIGFIPCLNENVTLTIYPFPHSLHTCHGAFIAKQIATLTVAKDLHPDASCWEAVGNTMKTSSIVHPLFHTIETPLTHVLFAFDSNWYPTLDLINVEVECKATQFQDEIQSLVHSLKVRDQTIQELTIKELMEQYMEASKK
ncbi:hypothetical protein OG21DRAFT_1525774 [Imleria badia]|nr:hypothetical protein OG21DRAFT_1525774 [Imleria badia]